MKAKYKVSLGIIGLLLAVTFSVTIGYGVYISTTNNSEDSSVTIGCFKAYFSSGQRIEMRNIDSLVNEEGLETSPYTLTVTNICDTKKTLEIRLNIPEDNTADTEALTINTSGDIEEGTILYKNLKNVKTDNVRIVQSKMIGKLEVNPNETIRTNIKIWFDEMKAPNMNQEEVFKASFELVDPTGASKYNFIESILADAHKASTKGTPSFKEPVTTADGIYLTTVNDENIYYYRGVVNNNYVKFGYHTWRVISVNENTKTIKLVLDKSAGSTNYANYSSTPDDAGIQFEYYYQMTDNNITKYLDNWYKQQIEDKGFDKYVVTSNYCNDSTSRKEIINSYFGAYDRTINDFNPTLTCPETTAKFGGNYSRKIGLLTADEIIMAGGGYDKNNHNYYLYNGENFFTMSPSHQADNKMNIFMVNNNGALSTIATNTTSGVRAVITIDGTVYVSGTGTIDNPYTINTEQE